MRGSLIFKLPEEQEEFELAQKGSLYKYSIEELDQWLRDLYKYQDQRNITIEEVRAKILTILSSRELS